MTTLNSKLLIAGGKDKSSRVTNRILTMDTCQTQLKDYTKMSIARSHATASGYEGMLIITGGKGDPNTLSSTEIFNSKNGQWYTCSDLPEPHHTLKSVIVDNNLCVLGGIDQNEYDSPAVFTAPLNSLSSHQLHWKLCRDAPWCRSAPLSFRGMHILIVAGRKKEKVNEYAYTSYIYKFNKVIDQWEDIGQIPSAAGYASAAVSTTDNRIIVIGGRNDKGKVINTVWIGSSDL